MRQGVSDYEPRVVHQLLNLMYRYASDILQDADVCPPNSDLLESCFNFCLLAARLFTSAAKRCKALFQLSGWACCKPALAHCSAVNWLSHAYAFW